MCHASRSWLRRSSLEAEFIAADDLANSILWTKYFLEEQGYEEKNTFLFKDNKSTNREKKHNIPSSSFVEGEKLNKEMLEELTQDF